VLLEGAAEVVAAVILGDKVEKILLCGIERSLKRLSSWITDWTRRKSRIKVGVVGRVES